MKTVNFFNENHVMALAEDLRRQNKKIKYLYLTNIYDYYYECFAPLDTLITRHGNFNESISVEPEKQFLKLLPVTEFCIIIWTKSCYSHYVSLNHAFSIEDFYLKLSRVPKRNSSVTQVHPNCL